MAKAPRAARAAASPKAPDPAPPTEPLPAEAAPSQDSAPPAQVSGAADEAASIPSPDPALPAEPPAAEGVPSGLDPKIAVIGEAAVAHLMAPGLTVTASSASVLFRKFPVIDPIELDGVRYEPGDDIPISRAHFDGLKSAKAILGDWPD